MNCEIIAVGDEVLTGDIVNTNAREIAAGLEDAGVRVRRQTVTSDNPAEIRQTLAEAFDRSDVILTIGGLGPTYDDITRESAAEQMGVPLVRDPETERRIREYFTATGRELTDQQLAASHDPRGRRSPGEPQRHRTGHLAGERRQDPGTAPRPAPRMPAHLPGIGTAPAA